MRSDLVADRITLPAARSALSLPPSVTKGIYRPTVGRYMVSVQDWAMGKQGTERGASCESADGT